MSVVNFDFLHDISLRNTFINSPQAFLQNKRSSPLSIDSENIVVSQNKPKLFKTFREETSSNENSTALKEESDSNFSVKNNQKEVEKANEFSIESLEKLLNNDNINTSDQFLEELCKILGLKENKATAVEAPRRRNKSGIKLSKKVTKKRVIKERDVKKEDQIQLLDKSKVTIVTKKDNAENQIKSDKKIFKPTKEVNSAKVTEEKEKNSRNKTKTEQTSILVTKDTKLKEEEDNFKEEHKETPKINFTPFNDIVILSADQVHKQNDSKNELAKDPTSTSKSIKKWSVFEDYLILVLYINYNGAWEKLLSIIKQTVTQMKRRCYYKINFHRKNEKMTLISRANNLHQEVVNQFKEEYNFSSLTHLTDFTEMLLGRMPNKLVHSLDISSMET